MLMVGFEDGHFSGEILDELRRLREHDIVRLVDLIFVTKDEAGDVALIEHTDLSGEEAEQFGALAGSLLGVHDNGEGEADDVSATAEEVWYVADAIPQGASAAIALLEHRWAIPLRDAIQAAHGEALADAWVHPDDLAALDNAA